MICLTKLKTHALISFILKCACVGREYLLKLKFINLSERLVIKIYYYKIIQLNFLTTNNSIKNFIIYFYTYACVCCLLLIILYSEKQ